MNPNDTNESVYAVACSEGKFLMVWNPKRDGWEMPGGHIQKGEGIEEAAKREFIEEAGYNIEIVKIRDLGYCHVCAAVLGEKVGDGAEMKVELLSEIPEKLSFDRAEYEDVIPWALKEIGKIL